MTTKENELHPKSDFQFDGKSKLWEFQISLNIEEVILRIVLEIHNRLQNVANRSNFPIFVFSLHMQKIAFSRLEVDRNALRPI